MWYVYLILCEDKSLYCGSTDDVEARFNAHKSGKGAKYTRSHKPVRIIYKEEFATKSESLKREAEIKKWSRAEKIKNLSMGRI